MESDQMGTPENPDKVSSDEEGASPVRSYDCTFCKRGFSNAQALGGHMNIHRKDKAKLKQVSSSETQRSTDTSKFAPSFSPNPTNATRPLMDATKSKATREITSSIKWPWFLQHNDVSERGNKTAGGAEIRQLPLFVDKPVSTDRNPSSEAQGKIDETFSSLNSNKQSFSGSELDLELRLGTEPHQDSSAATNTRKFF